MNNHCILSIALLVIVCLQPSFAQDDNTPILLPTQTPPPSSLPPLPDQYRAGQTDSLSSHASIYIQGFHIQGNTILSNAQLEQATQPYIGRQVSIEELHELRKALTHMYIASGYLSSGVLLPDQDVDNGFITLTVIEGVLANIEITGAKRLRSQYLTDRIWLSQHEPLQLSNLEEQLQLLRQDPLIKSVNGQLMPGAKLGESVLSIDIRENTPYQASITVNNHRAPSIGSIRTEMNLAHQNLLGYGDRIGLRYDLTQGLDDFSVNYSIPWLAGKSYVNLAATRSDALVVEEPLNELLIQSKSEGYSLELGYRLYRRLRENLQLSFTLENQRNISFLAGDRFNFSTGVVNGKSEVTVLRFSADWLRHSERQAIALRATLSRGIDLFDPTINADVTDGRFTSLLGQFQWALRFGPRQSQLLLRSNVQLTPDSLFAMEKFPVGGATTVRGYRENQMVRDNGWTTSIEMRHPLFIDQTGQKRIQGAVFLDAGRAWNKDINIPAAKAISSIGGGIVWQYGKYLSGEIYLAHGFRKFSGTDYDLQDDGVHFQLHCNFF